MVGAPFHDGGPIEDGCDVWKMNELDSPRNGVAPNRRLDLPGCAYRLF